MRQSTPGGLNAGVLEVLILNPAFPYAITVDFDIQYSDCMNVACRGTIEASSLANFWYGKDRLPFRSPLAGPAILIYKARS